MRQPRSILSRICTESSTCARTTISIAAYALFPFLLNQTQIAHARLDPPAEVWGAGIQLRFPTSLSAEFFNRADVIPYAYFFMEDAADLDGQQLSFTIEPKLIFRLDLERGTLHSVKFRVGGKLLVSDVEIESTPLLILDQQGQGIVFDPITMLPTVNGISHSDLGKAAVQIKKGISELQYSESSKLRGNLHLQVQTKCEETTHPAPRIETHFAIVQNLEERLEFRTSQMAPVLDEKTTEQIHEAWLRLIRENPELLEKFPQLQLRLKFPWRKIPASSPLPGGLPSSTRPD